MNCNEYRDYVAADVDGYVDLECLLKCLLQLAVLRPIQVGDFVLDMTLQRRQEVILVAEVKNLAAFAGQVGVQHRTVERIHL